MGKKKPQTMESPYTLSQSLRIIAVLGGIAIIVSLVAYVANKYTMPREEKKAAEMRNEKGELTLEGQRVIEGNFTKNTRPVTSLSEEEKKAIEDNFKKK